MYEVILTRKIKLDSKDIEILKLLQKNSRIPLDEIARILNMPKSTIHYRIKRLEKLGVIESYYAKLNVESLGKDYITATFVRAKYGPGYHEVVGKKLASISGVWAVYFVLGDIDFIVLSRADDRDDFMRILNQMMSIKEIERTSTHVIIKVIKEDPRIEL